MNKIDKNGKILIVTVVSVSVFKNLYSMEKNVKKRIYPKLTKETNQCNTHILQFRAKMEQAKNQQTSN